jgi:hypothetical protein
MPGLETGSRQEQKTPEGCIPQGSSVVRYDLLSLQVVAPPLHVGKELAERVPPDDVRTALGTLAVPDGGYLTEVGGDLDAASVVRTKAGLPPDSSRQISHLLTPFA